MSEPQAELPIARDDERHRRMVAWIRESSDVAWMPAYDGAASILASLMLDMDARGDQVPTADKTLMTRLLEGFGLTPLSNARLKRWMAEQPGLDTNQFQEFKKVHL